MQYALIDNNKVLPRKGFRGICQCCGNEVIAKCGQYKIDHWAHKTLEGCDPWWETETEWHRNWKNKFPAICHEQIMYDPITNEKHIADVCTLKNNVIEFQHSSIKPEETLARETFYIKDGRKMIWVVDGDTGLNKGNFDISRPGRLRLNGDINFTWYSTSKIFDKWIKSKAYVLFDFHDGALWYLKQFDPISKEVCLNLRSIEDFINKA